MRRSLLAAVLPWSLPSWIAPVAYAQTQTPVPPSLREQAARLLATLIRVGRESAIGAGVKTVPPRIQHALRGFFPEAVLRKARYAGGEMERIGLPGFGLTYGDVAAMTLGEVILFRDDHRARTDAKLWAHELTHVMQYERWGIDDFAARYLDDSEAVEREARDNADRFVKWSEHAPS